MKDFYAILGVTQNAEDVVIKAACFAMSQRYHPDKYTGDPDEANKRMIEINEARNVLCDPESRREYDNNRTGNSTKFTRKKNTEHKDTPSNPVNESQPDEAGLQELLNSKDRILELLNNKDWSGYKNCWISTKNDLIFVDSFCKASLSTFDELKNALIENGNRNNSDRSVKVIIICKENVIEDWDNLKVAFSRLVHSRKNQKLMETNVLPFSFYTDKAGYFVFPTLIVETDLSDNITSVISPTSISFNLGWTKTETYKSTGRTVPSNARRTNYWFDHENKDGSPDKRFNENNKTYEYESSIHTHRLVMNVPSGRFKMDFVEEIDNIKLFCSAYSRFAPPTITHITQRTLPFIYGFLAVVITTWALYTTLSGFFLNLLTEIAPYVKTVGIIAAIITFLISTMVRTILIWGVILYLCYLGYSAFSTSNKTVNIPQSQTIPSQINKPQESFKIQKGDASGLPSSTQQNISKYENKSVPNSSEISQNPEPKSKRSSADDL